MDALADSLTTLNQESGQDLRSKAVTARCSAAAVTSLHQAVSEELAVVAVQMQGQAAAQQTVQAHLQLLQSLLLQTEGLSGPDFAGSHEASSLGLRTRSMEHLCGADAAQAQSLRARTSASRSQHEVRTPLFLPCPLHEPVSRALERSKG